METQWCIVLLSQPRELSVIGLEFYLDFLIYSEEALGKGIREGEGKKEEKNLAYNSSVVWPNSC